MVSTALFCGSALVLALLGRSPWAVLIATAAWGMAFGGAATLFQTASARVSGDSADIAQSMVVTVWNAAIAGGGALGGLLLKRGCAGALPWSLVALLTAVWIIVASSHKAGFD